MVSDEILGIVQFLRDAEQLKNVYRTAWTSGGQPESTAAHTWRLCLSALIFARSFPEVNVERLLKICIIHDLGEAIHGDIPAIHQDAAAPKAGQERQDLITLLQPLPSPIQQEIVDLWDEYEAATTPEAKVAKALDKLETLLQHNQGANPPDFDYLFNVGYARKFTDAVPLVAEIRKLVDEETRQNAVRRKGANAMATNSSDNLPIEVVVTHQFNAPAEQVFDAWLDPEVARHWLFATATGIMQRVEIDARVGGEFVIAEQRGDMLAEHFGRYLEIDRPRRLVFTMSAQSRDEENPSLVTVEIVPNPAGCELRLTHRIAAAWAEYADQTSAGWAMVLDGLDHQLTADRQIVITRTFAAPRELVWRAWTDPKHVDQWWGPDGFRNETFAMDVRPGGMWRYVMHGPDGTDYGNRIVYHAVVAPERLVYTHSSDVDNDPDAFAVTVTFAAQGDKTLLTMRSRFATAEQRQATIAFGAVEGGNQTLKRLAKYVKQMDR